MQFKIIKELKGGRFFVKIDLTEFNESDKARALKFGIPTLAIKTSNGTLGNVRITSIGNIDPYGFYKQEEADQYTSEIKKQIFEIRRKWDSLDDNWSNEEIL